MGVPVSNIAAPIIAKHGGGILARLKTEWAVIVGSDWAAVAWPSAFGRDGVLKLCTPPMAALELQHRAPVLIERINLFFGRSVVSRLALVQGLLPLDSPSPRRLIATPAASEATVLDKRLSGIADPDLREALRKLGHAVISVRC